MALATARRTVRRRGGRIKRTLKRLSFTFLILSIVFLGFEIGVRLWDRFGGPAPGQGWAIEDTDIGYRMRPNHEGSNAHGLLDEPIDPIKSRFRILVLGDSIGFYGDNPADTYVGHLEDRLGEDPSLADMEVINASVKGYTNYQELLYLRKFGLDFEPDLVGVSFCLNDLHKFAHRFVFKNGEAVGRGYAFTDEAVDSVDSRLYALARKSRFLVWLRRRLSVFDDVVELAIRGGFTFDYRPDFNTAWKDEAWIDIELQLREMVTLGEKHGFRVFLVVFPFAEQLREEYLEQDYDYVRKPQRMLGEICKRLDIPYLDLFDGFDRETHLMEDQIHLTHDGRELAAVRISEFLKQEGLVPAASRHTPEN